MVSVLIFLKWLLYFAFKAIVHIRASVQSSIHLTEEKYKSKANFTRFLKKRRTTSMSCRCGEYSQNFTLTLKAICPQESTAAETHDWTRDLAQRGEGYTQIKNQCMLPCFLLSLWEWHHQHSITIKNEKDTRCLLQVCEMSLDFFFLLLWFLN